MIIVALLGRDFRPATLAITVALIALFQVTVDVIEEPPDNDDNVLAPWPQPTAPGRPESRP